MRFQTKKTHSKKRQFITIALGVSLIAFGVWAFWQQYQTTHNPTPAIRGGTVTHSTDEPDETPIKECPEAAADMPRKIELPSLDKSGCIQPVGIDQDEKIAVPTNIHVVGWFVDSPKPGDPGVSIIDGHVQGRYSEAIFKHLGMLEEGDMVRVEFGDKSERQFKVATTNQYSAEQTATEQFKQLANIDKQLTLITCGGTFNRDTEQYDKRIVVRAELFE